jgi:hypothetical protein
MSLASRIEDIAAAQAATDEALAELDTKAEEQNTHVEMLEEAYGLNVEPTIREAVIARKKKR